MNYDYNKSQKKSNSNSMKKGPSKLRADCDCCVYDYENVDTINTNQSINKNQENIYRTDVDNSLIKSTKNSNNGSIKNNSCKQIADCDCYVYESNDTTKDDYVYENNNTTKDKKRKCCPRCFEIFRVKNKKKIQKDQKRISSISENQPELIMSITRINDGNPSKYSDYKNASLVNQEESEISHQLKKCFAEGNNLAAARFKNIEPISEQKLDSAGISKPKLIDQLKQELLALLLKECEKNGNKTCCCFSSKTINSQKRDGGYTQDGSECYPYGIPQGTFANKRSSRIRRQENLSESNNGQRRELQKNFEDSTEMCSDYDNCCSNKNRPLQCHCCDNNKSVFQVQTIGEKNTNQPYEENLETYKKRRSSIQPVYENIESSQNQQIFYSGQLPAKMEYENIPSSPTREYRCSCRQLYSEGYNNKPSIQPEYGNRRSIQLEYDSRRSSIQPVLSSPEYHNRKSSLDSKYENIRPSLQTNYERRRLSVQPEYEKSKYRSEYGDRSSAQSEYNEDKQPHCIIEDIINTEAHYVRSDNSISSCNQETCIYMQNVKPSRGQASVTSLYEYEKNSNVSKKNSIQNDSNQNEQINVDNICYPTSFYRNYNNPRAQQTERNASYIETKEREEEEGEYSGQNNPLECQCSCCCSYPLPLDYSRVYKDIESSATNGLRNPSVSSSPPQENFSPQHHSSMSMDNEITERDTSVRVSVRIRPQNSREVIDMCRICTSVTPDEPQIVLGLDKAFTFDYVFNINSAQHELYTVCVERLVNGALNGYNATVLAYGQTGSGKTYTMGTGFDCDISDDDQGIIPRAVRHMFAAIDDIQRKNYQNESILHDKEQFSVAVQFLEIYNEDIIDLLDSCNKGKLIKIHEDGNTQISVRGATIKPVQGPQDALKYLHQGSLARTTASTRMNDQSSRSHAIFTILIKRQHTIKTDENSPIEDSIENLMSKFNFVDLAGSERLKRTGSTGERAREGISINSGLLALGNCISALGDKSRKATHVPYRDSKLTRLLQDSLGGNSQTLMIACISPSDRDFMETLNTLKYANRARNIKNRIHVNQDQSSRTISQLRREIAALQLELLDFKQGKFLTDAEGNTALSDTFLENTMLMAENKQLQQRFKVMQETINALTKRNKELKLELTKNTWSHALEGDKLVPNIPDIVEEYVNEIELLRTKLIQSEATVEQMNRLNRTNSTKSNISYDSEDFLNLVKREIEKDREILMSQSLPGLIENSSDYNNMENTIDSEDSSGSDVDPDEKAKVMQEDLNDINSDIEIKMKLIEQLELAKQRMQIMQQHYEEKLNILNCRIINTQKERDEVLANLSNKPITQSSEKLRKVRDEYERKINDIQRELKILQQTQREHQRQQQELKAKEMKLKNLHSELSELKCIKVRLMRKLTEQTNKHKEENNRKAREIAQLRKEHRRQTNTVKTLQEKMQAKDQILKRKTEEVSALRNSRRIILARKSDTSFLLEKNLYANDLVVARRCWDQMHHTLLRLVRNKEVLVKFEKELERLMNERESLSHELMDLKERQKTSTDSDLYNEEDTIKSNLNYLQDSISDVQQTIMDFEDGKNSINADKKKINSLINTIRNINDAKFLMEKLTNSTILVHYDWALAQGRLTECEALLKEAHQENTVKQQLLQHFLDQDNAIHISDMFQSLKLYNLNGSQKSLNSSGTYDIPASERITDPLSSSTSITSMLNTFDEKNVKIRRRTAHQQDLLFGDNKVDENSRAIQLTKDM